MKFFNQIFFILSLGVASFTQANDITQKVFGSVKDGVVAAFGDFNSDELTDVFVISNEFTTLQILLGSYTEPLLYPGPFCIFNKKEITSVVPGDFDGDALMDVLITTRSNEGKDLLDVYINWGASDTLICANDSYITTKGEPLAIDYNRDMIIDLFGVNSEEERIFWVFQKNRLPPQVVKQIPAPNKQNENNKIQTPHANAYLDINHDFTADLFVQTEKFFEVWYGKTDDDKQGFLFNHKVNIDIIGADKYHVGQSVFLDLELKGIQNQILPMCFRDECTNSTILAHDGESFRDIHVNFKDPQGVQWGFIEPVHDDVYLKTITARGGDYNMDGYPDLLLTLRAITGPKKRMQTFLLENVPCTVCNGPLKRTFEVKWNALSPMGNDTVAGAFYDFYQDGVLDVILMEKKNGKYRPLAFRNTLDYDANFVKVIVLTALTNKFNPTEKTALGRKKRTYGTNLPGPRIEYFTTTQEGDIQRGSSVQLPQSAYFALQMPYTIFGLGRTPNFVDTLIVGLANKSRTWTQLIPNSQIIVVPQPIEEPQRWKAQLFVTPSKLILMSVVALGGTCLVIILIILVLYIKEKKEDKQEKLQEAHRFHFDAM